MENEGEVRTDMAEAIHAGYTAEDPAARERFRKMFDGEEPSIEAFIGSSRKLVGYPPQTLR